jgi:adenylate kinase family enzyme
MEREVVHREEPMGEESTERGPAAPRHIHILGASGSGTTTLGAALADRLGYTHLDTDSFYWEPTDPPFQRSRPVAERQSLLGAALDASPSWILSGSLVSWADPFIPLFDCAIFLQLPATVRMERLKERELKRYGADRLSPGGDMHDTHLEFLAWASQYESAGVEMRSLAMHQAWMKQLTIPIYPLDGLLTTEQQIALLLQLFHNR